MAARFPITVKPYHERLAQINHEVETSIEDQRFYSYRDEIQNLKVIRVPIGLLLYRVANYRTTLLQLKWIKEKHSAGDFFSAGEENESVQKIQHEFLWGLANAEKESITSIITTLKKEKQREPILISAAGIVVNGNRRLAAMRELFADPSTNSNLKEFSHVNCMVLPAGASEDDLKDIEVRLQMTPETRLPYGWINECIAVKDLINRGKRTIDDIGDLMRIDAPRVRERLMMLDEVTMYINDWNKQVDYESLSGAEEIVAQITNRLKKKEGLDKELSRRIGWILLDQRGREGRIYDLREATGALTSNVIEKIQEEFAEEISNQESNNESLDLDFSDDETQTDKQNLISFFESCKGNDAVQEEIVTICRNVIEKEKTKTETKAALKAVKDAHTKLVELDLSTASRDTYEAIEMQLNAIIVKSQGLLETLNRYKEQK